MLLGNVTVHYSTQQSNNELYKPAALKIGNISVRTMYSIVKPPEAVQYMVSTTIHKCVLNLK
jgi:hypothetical protein